MSKVPKAPKSTLSNEEPTARIRVLSELVRPAIYCRSWVPYLRIVLLLPLLILLVVIVHLLLAGHWLW